MPKTKQFNEDEVLDKAMHLFWRKGYSATSMQDLVDHLGLSRSSIYDTFSGKDQLFHRVLERYIDQNSSNAQNQAVAVVEGKRNAKDFLSDLLFFLADGSASDPELKGCFVANATGESINYPSETTQLLVKNRNVLVEAFTTAIQAGQARGEIKNTQPAADLASYLFMFMNGMRLTSRIENGREHLRTAVKVALQVLD